VTSITLGFEVHQPYRVREDFFWNKRMFRRLGSEPTELFEHYFSPRNREIFKRVAERCYRPANDILLDCIDRHKKERKAFKCAFSLSGIFLEQCERYDRELLESFKELVDTGCVELLDQTYHHSLFSLYEEPELFIEDVLRHRRAVKELFGLQPKVFENTEFLYNNRIARMVDSLGYKAVYTEGVERITGGRSPNHVYKAKDCELKVLLRNYRLTDDIGFRFSSRDWEEYPLTADKYASWLASTPGDCINLFLDYETFGEHHWRETGIFQFLSSLPEEVLKWEHLEFAKPSEVIEGYDAAGEVDAYELGNTVSWADLERDTSCWLGNSMQWACYTYHKQLRPRVLSKELLRIWGYLSTSDHLYYMFTAGGGPGEVHSYFSPFDDPFNAFLNYLSILFDLDMRIRRDIDQANEPFLFSDEDGSVKAVAFGKRDFAALVKTLHPRSVRFHLERGDFQNWARHSLRDEMLARSISELRKRRLSDKVLRKRLAEVFEKALER